jgi:peptidyl-prolyl cis-trans isomerase C
MRPMIVLLLGALAAGCQKTPEAAPEAQASAAALQPASQTTAGATAQPAASQQPPAPLPDKLPDVVARVNGDDISRTDFERAVSNLEDRAGGPVPAEQKPKVFRDVLDQMIAFKLLIQESKAQNVSITDTELDQSIAKIRQQFPNEQEFTSALGQRRMTLDDLKKETRDQMTVDKMVRGTLSDVTVTDAEISSFYQGNGPRFQQPEGVRASHILIKAANTAPDATKKEARTKAEGLLKEAQSGGDFAALAKANSEDGSAADGGDLGFFQRGQMVPEFENAAFALQPGQLSSIVESQFGYHIIKVTERRAARTVPLEEAKDRIREYLTAQHRQEKVLEYVQSLRAKGKVEVFI